MLGVVLAGVGGATARRRGEPIIVGGPSVPPGLRVAGGTPSGDGCDGDRRPDDTTTRYALHVQAAGARVTTPARHRSCRLCPSRRPHPIDRSGGGEGSPGGAPPWPRAMSEPRRRAPCRPHPLLRLHGSSRGGCRRPAERAAPPERRAASSGATPEPPPGRTPTGLARPPAPPAGPGRSATRSGGQGRTRRGAGLWRRRRETVRWSEVLSGLPGDRRPRRLHSIRITEVGFQ